MENHEKVSYEFLREKGIEDKKTQEKYLKFRENLDRIILGLESSTGDNLVKCFACKDSYPQKIAELTGKFCIECYEEIQFGVIAHYSTKYIPSHKTNLPFNYDRSNDDNSWHNAVKAIEGISD
jgi:hypothetical protein